MEQRQFMISGLDRRAKKKELAQLKQYVKMFWYYEDIDRVYGGGHSDEDCVKLINKANKLILKLEQQLVIKYETAKESKQ